ncbi:MAG: hypothetical protein U0074_10420 [Kouleothrix sp.]|jgi:hypothetical protein
MTPAVFTDYVPLQGGGRILPTFQGYTVDVRCREFRKIDADTAWELWGFIDFDSDQGEEMLQALIQFLPVDSILFQELGRLIIG